MKVRIYPGKTVEEFGAVRWDVSWEEVKPEASARIKAAEAKGAPEDIDPDRDIEFMHRYFMDDSGGHDEAIVFAQEVVASGRTAYGQVTVQKEVVDWFVEEDRIAEWADAGEPEHFD